MDVKIIRTTAQYEGYLTDLHTLMAAAPAPGTPEADRLELLTVLIEAYEREHFPVEAPDPIDAILFRMNEQGLKQADLVPYFGTRSRVSEVLSRKRPLTVQMIRAISIGLGISAETLIGSEKPAPSREPTNSVDLSRFPITGKRT